MSLSWVSFVFISRPVLCRRVSYLGHTSNGRENLQSAFPISFFFLSPTFRVKMKKATIWRTNGRRISYSEIQFRIIVQLRPLIWDRAKVLKTLHWRAKPSSGCRNIAIHLTCRLLQSPANSCSDIERWRRHGSNPICSSDNQVRRQLISSREKSSLSNYRVSMRTSNFRMRTSMLSSEGTKWKRLNQCEWCAQLAVSH